MPQPDRFEQSATFAALIGRQVENARILPTDSRNTLIRLTLDGGEKAFLKFFDAPNDPHGPNRFRREEKVLTLLANVRPPVAPRPLGGWVCAEGTAGLLMEDAGTENLADRLMKAENPVELWEQTAKFVDALYDGMRLWELPLQRTALSISLDKVNAATLMIRFRTAVRRVTGGEVESRVLSAFRQFVRPALAGGREVIHNSLSPLNIVPDDSGWRAIDWETVTWANPAWDWAELLRAPYRPLPLTQAVEIAARRVDGDAFLCASLCRCLDALGTVTLRRQSQIDKGNEEGANEYLRRALFYAEDILRICELIPPAPALTRELERITRTVESA